MIIIKILLLVILYTLLFLLGVIFIAIISPIKAYAKFNDGYILLKGNYLYKAISFYYEKTNKENLLIVKVFGIKLPIENKNKENNNAKEEENKKKEKINKKSKYGMPSKKVIKLALRLINKLLTRIFPKNVHMYLTIGLDDPYYTGLIQMVSQIVFIPLNSINGYDFRITPVYLDYEFKYDIEGEINFSIISLIIPVILFIFKPPIFNYLFKKKNTQSKKRLSTS